MAPNIGVFGRIVNVMDLAKTSIRLVKFTKATGKNIKSTDLVFIERRMAKSIGVFGRMISLMAKDGTRNQMELAMAWNMRTEYV